MNSRARPYLGIFIGGLAAGVLDILYAFVLAALRDGTPLRVLQSVASGVLGSSAYQGGIAAGALGLVLHLGITVAAAGVYFLIAWSSRHVREHFIVFGSLFGVLVCLFMNFAVLPLSGVTFRITYTPMVFVQGFVSHALLVGVPIAWSLNHFNFGRQNAA